MEFGPQFITIAGTPIGDLQIRYYGIIIVFAILVAATVAARLARRDGKDPDHVWGAMFWAVIFGIIGARLWFILFPPESLIAAGRDAGWYLQNFFNWQEGAIAIWSGGLSIFGAFLGGGAATLAYLRWNKLPIAPWLDIAVVALPLGQFIGRWANFVNQELYGSPTGSTAWGIAIDSQFRVAPYTSTIDFPAETLFHPLFLYEGMWSLVAFFALLFIWERYRKQLRPGTITLLFIAQYCFIRYVLEFLRVELSIVTLDLGDQLVRVNTAQLITGVGFIVSVGLLLVAFRPRVSAPLSSTPAMQKSA
ncbi:MAG: prolipoprotein diacylglyceryl transferase [Armatimonadetes bacterium]|nr:prolipoprotein diacylglyceryl transferase [Anaerolineae bacterium]